MSKISNFFSKVGVAVGAVVASIAAAVNIGAARAPINGTPVSFGSLLGVAVTIAGVIAVGTTVSVVKAVKNTETKQIGTSANGNKKNTYSGTNDKSNKNQYSSKVPVNLRS